MPPKPSIYAHFPFHTNRFLAYRVGGAQGADSPQKYSECTPADRLDVSHEVQDGWGGGGQGPEGIGRKGEKWKNRCHLLLMQNELVL